MSISTLMIRGIVRALVQTGVFAALLFLAGLALWLESYASVVVLPVAFLPVIARIVVEERTLRETLPGYGGYMRKVRYRLVPFIW